MKTVERLIVEGSPRDVERVYRYCLGRLGRSYRHMGQIQSAYEYAMSVLGV